MTVSPSVWALAACSVATCDRAVKVKGMCSKHYQRHLLGVDVAALRPHELSVEDRFWSKVDKHGPGGCWLWTGGLNTYGYGRFAITHSESAMAHRLAYEWLVGPIPAGLELDHVRAWGCRHRACVNPAHLEPVTPAENLRRVPENPSTINAAKTHCHVGHPFSGGNLYVRPNGKRECRACRDARHRRDQLAKQARPCR